MPSTIGPFSNVPAAGDPLTSAWAQQLTQYTVDRVAPIQDSGWIAPTFSAGWSNNAFGYSTAGYRRLNNLVVLRGLVTGPLNTTIFVLPIYFRPHLSRALGTTSAQTHGEIQVNTAGEVSATAGATTSWISLDGLIVPDINGPPAAGMLPADAEPEPEAKPKRPRK